VNDHVSRIAGSIKGMVAGIMIACRRCWRSYIRYLSGLKVITRSEGWLRNTSILQNLIL
jgi:hypothetical protein